MINPFWDFCLKSYKFTHTPVTHLYLKMSQLIDSLMHANNVVGASLTVYFSFQQLGTYNLKSNPRPLNFRVLLDAHPTTTNLNRVIRFITNKKGNFTTQISNYLITELPKRDLQTDTYLKQINLSRTK